MPKPVVEPPQEVGPAVNLVDGRDGSATDPLTTGGDGLGARCAGGHGEVLRGSRGQACRGKAGRRSRQPVCGERGNRPRAAYPPASLAGGGYVRRLLMGRGRGGGPVVPAQPGPAGLDQLLPTGIVCGDLRLPHPLQLVACGPMAPPQTPPGQLEATPSPLHPVARPLGRRRGLVQTGSPRDHPIPLPGNAHPVAVVPSRRTRRRMRTTHDLVAGCVGTRTSGSEGRAGETERTERSTPRPGPIPTTGCATARSVAPPKRRRDPFRHSQQRALADRHGPHARGVAEEVIEPVWL